MAEKDKDKKDKLEKEDQEIKEVTAPQRKKVPINLIVVIILVLCLIGGGVYAWKSGLFKASPDDEAAIEEQANNQDIGPIYSLDSFIVNLAGGRSKNYLKTRMELELDSENTSVEMNKRLPQVRDTILTMLSSKTNEDISTLEGKLQLRAEIISTLNQLLKAGKIKNVYFTDFIIQ
jgi:flagellar protein FliL